MFFHFEKFSEKKVDYSFDVKIHDLSVPQVFRAIPALPEELWSFLLKKFFFARNVTFCSQPREAIHKWKESELLKGREACDQEFLDRFKKNSLHNRSALLTCQILIELNTPVSERRTRSEQTSGSEVMFRRSATLEWYSLVSVRTCIVSVTFFQQEHC